MPTRPTHYVTFYNHTQILIFHNNGSFWQKLCVSSILWRRSLRITSYSKVGRSETWVWSAGSLVVRSPTWFSTNLVYWGRRQVISIPSMEVTWKTCFFLKIASWDINVATTLVWCRGHQCQWSWSTVTAGSSSAGSNRCPYCGRIWRLLWLIVCLKRLDSITSTSIAARIRRNHWRCSRVPGSSSRTAKLHTLIINLMALANFHQPAKLLSSIVY